MKSNIAFIRSEIFFISPLMTNKLTIDKKWLRLGEVKGIMSDELIVAGTEKDDVLNSINPRLRAHFESQGVDFGALYDQKQIFLHALSYKPENVEIRDVRFWKDVQKYKDLYENLFTELAAENPNHTTITQNLNTITRQEKVNISNLVRRCENVIGENQKNEQERNIYENAQNAAERVLTGGDIVVEENLSISPHTLKDALGKRRGDNYQMHPVSTKELQNITLNPGKETVLVTAEQIDSTSEVASVINKIKELKEGRSLLYTDREKYFEIREGLKELGNLMNQITYWEKNPDEVAEKREEWMDFSWGESGEWRVGIKGAKKAQELRRSLLGKKRR